MTDIDITCRPGEGILRVSADAVAALDALAKKLTAALEDLAHALPDDPWQIDVLVGRTPTDTLRLTARPHTNEPEEAEAA